MGTTLVICLFLVTHLCAESIARSSSATSISASTDSSLFDGDEALAKVATSCITPREHEQLSGNLFRLWYARMFNEHLIINAQEIIGHTELRAALGFAPLGPWTNYRYEEPSAGDLAAATTIEQYFDLREPRSHDRSLDSSFFFEKNFPPVIAFLDKRFPAIRNYFRRKFAEILRLDFSSGGGTKDRKTVDHMINEYTNSILPNVARATNQMYWNSRKCMRGQ